MSKVVSQENLVEFGQQFKNKLSTVAISGSYNDLVDIPDDLQEYRQFTIYSDQAEGDYPNTPGTNDWKWYTDLGYLATASSFSVFTYGDWSTVATTTDSTPIVWVATATFRSSDGRNVSGWEVYQATGSTGAAGVNGQNGAKGDTGNGIVSITKTGTSGLEDTYTITFSDGTTTTFTVINGEKGDPGTPGTNGTNGVNVYSIQPDNTFIAVQVSPTATVVSNVSETCNINLYYGSDSVNISDLGIEDSTYQQDTKTISNVTFTGHKTSGYYDYVTISINSGQVLSSIVNADIYVRSSDGTCSKQFKIIVAPVKEGQTGTNGVGISSVVEYYLASSNSTGITTSTSGWSTNIPTTNATNKYLWNYERVNYSDSTHDDTDPVIISMYSEDGRGISSITEHYLATSSSTGVTKSTSGWTTSIQTVTSTNKYLWNYETVTYTDNTTSDTDPVIIGTYGDKGDPGTNGTNGRGIASKTVKYMLTGTTTAPSASNANWGDNIIAPTSSAKYLWKKTIITYTDNTTENDIDLITIYTDAAASDIAYLVETFGEANVSNNDGVYLNNLIAVKNTANNQPIAMMNGTDVLSDNNEGKMIIAAGMNGLDSTAQGYTEPVFQVYESGKLVAQDAEIEGSITATSGNIGGFEISASELAAENTTSQNEMSLSADDIKFTNGSGDYVRLGGSLSSDSYITVTYNGSTYGISASNIGLYQDGLGMAIKDGALAISNPGDKAILANGDIYLNGDINTTGYASTRKKVKVLSSSISTILDSDLRTYGTFICSGETIVRLPELSDDNNGIISRFLFPAGGTIYCSSNDGSVITTFGNVGTAPTTGRPSCTVAQGSVIEVIFSSNSGDTGIYIYPINNNMTTV